MNPCGGGSQAPGRRQAASGSWWNPASDTKDEANVQRMRSHGNLVAADEVFLGLLTISDHAARVWLDVARPQGPGDDFPWLHGHQFALTVIDWITLSRRIHRRQA